jgi:hypothetical protein
MLGCSWPKIVRITGGSGLPRDHNTMNKHLDITVCEKHGDMHSDSGQWKDINCEPPREGLSEMTS